MPETPSNAGGGLRAVPSGQTLSRPRAAEEIGRAVRAARVGQGWGVRQLAAAAGCSPGYISMLERGQRGGGGAGGADGGAGNGGGADGGDGLRRVEAALGLAPGALARVGLKALLRASDRSAAVARANLDAAWASGELAALVDAAGVDAQRVAGEHMAGEARDASGGATRGERARMHAEPLARALPLEVPLINAVAAGEPREFTDLGYPARVADEYVRVPAGLVRAGGASGTAACDHEHAGLTAPRGIDDPDAFAARVVGDSMEPEYHAGDIVVFSPATRVVDGMDCFVRLEPDQETTFKRVEFVRAAESPGTGEKSEDEGEGEERQRPVVAIRLVALNSKYPARVVDREMVAGLYAAVSVTRAVGRRGGGVHV